MKPKPFRVSDHALMRYVERVLGFDLDHVRAEIAAKARMAALAGARTITVGNAVFCINECPRDIVVTTVKLTGTQNIPKFTPPRTRQASREFRKWTGKAAAEGRVVRHER